MSSIRRLRTPSPSSVVDLLAAPALAAPLLSERLIDVLVARLATAAEASGATRIDAFVAEHGAARFATPFRWSARAARRPLGTGALRRLCAGTSSDVLGAAREELEALCDRAERGLARRGALGTWLAAAPTEVRALCAIEAATWASGLCHLVDVEAHADRVAVGIPDAWFAVPGARAMLHGRRDAMCSGAGGPAGGILRLRDGAPGSQAIDGLLVDGLIAAIGGRTVPARILGAWPDAGMLFCVELDADAVRRAARMVVTCAQEAGPSRTSSVQRAIAA